MIKRRSNKKELSLPISIVSHGFMARLNSERSVIPIFPIIAGRHGGIFPKHILKISLGGKTQVCTDFQKGSVGGGQQILSFFYFQGICIFCNGKAGL